MDRPTERAIELVLRLVEEQGSNWLDVLERMLLQEYRGCFKVCVKCR